MDEKNINRNLRKNISLCNTIYPCSYIFNDYLLQQYFIEFDMFKISTKL